MTDAAHNEPADGYHYWAFISYSHQDNLPTRGDGRGDHIQWANWLHEQLETFRIPDGYCDRPTRTHRHRQGGPTHHQPEQETEAPAYDAAALLAAL